MLDIALEEPLAPFNLGGLGKGNDAIVPRVEKTHKTHDSAILAGSVAPFEYDKEPARNPCQMGLQVYELDLK
jgi:hypothetical protein